MLYIAMRINFISSGIESMPELVDKVQPLKICFPGIHDNCKKMEPIPEAPAPVPAPEAVAVAAKSRKPLKLGKTKG
jgi:hypothetical protein